MFAHFYTKIDIQNVLNNIINNLKLTITKYTHTADEAVSENIFNDVPLAEKYYKYASNIILVSPLKSITGEYNLSSIIYSNISPSELDDLDKDDEPSKKIDVIPSPENPDNLDKDIPKSMINLNIYKFNDLDFYIENELYSEVKDGFVKQVTSHIMNVFEYDELTKSKIFNDLNITRFDEDFFNNVFNQKDVIIEKNGKKYYKIKREITLNSKSESKLVKGKNKFNIHFYINQNFNPKKEAEIEKQRKII
ncbi:UNVERIFIED_CONTAM: hypothetical protein O8I53_13660 [Campylobacter lari]